MSLRKFFLAFAFFCIIPAYGMYNMDASITFTSPLLEDILKKTYVADSFIPFEYLDEKTDPGADILNAIAEAAKCGSSHLSTSQKIGILEIDDLISNHKTKVNWFNSRLSKAWRFVTFRRNQTIDDNLYLSLAQAKLFWETIEQRGGAIKSTGSPQRATEKLAKLQTPIDMIEKHHLENIKEKQQTKYLVEYTWDDSAPLALPNSHVPPLVNQFTDPNNPLDHAPKEGSTVLPGTQCWPEDKDTHIRNTSTGWTTQIKNCQAKQFDLSSDRYFAASVDDNGKNQLRVYALPADSKPEYEISQDGTKMNLVPQTATIETPCWTRQLQTDCSTFALWQDQPQLAYAIGNTITLTQLPTTLPAKKTLIAKFLAAIAVINVFRFFRQQSAEEQPKLSSITLGNDVTKIKKIVPLTATSFLCLTEKGALYKVEKKITPTNNGHLEATLVTTGRNNCITDVAVDQHTNLIAYSSFDGQAQKTNIDIANKNTLIIGNVAAIDGSKSMRIDSTYAPTIQCYKGNISVWHPQLRLTPGIDIHGVRPTEIVPGQYEKIQSIRTSFAEEAKLTFL